MKLGRLFACVTAATMALALTALPAAAQRGGQDMTGDSLSGWLITNKADTFEVEFEFKSNTQVTVDETGVGTEGSYLRIGNELVMFFTKDPKKFSSPMKSALFGSLVNGTWRGVMVDDSGRRFSWYVKAGPRDGSLPKGFEAGGIQATIPLKASFKGTESRLNGSDSYPAELIFDITVNEGSMQLKSTSSAGDSVQDDGKFNLVEYPVGGTQYLVFATAKRRVYGGILVHDQTSGQYTLKGIGYINSLKEPRKFEVSYP